MIRAFNGTGGSSKWTYDTGDPSARFLGGVSVGGDGMVYTASDKRKLYASVRYQQREQTTKCPSGVFSPVRTFVAVPVVVIRITARLLFLPHSSPVAVTVEGTFSSTWRMMREAGGAGLRARLPGSRIIRVRRCLGEDNGVLP